MDELIFKTICKNQIKYNNENKVKVITKEDLDFLKSIKEYTIDEYGKYTKSKDELKYYFLNKVPEAGKWSLEITDGELKLKIKDIYRVHTEWEARTDIKLYVLDPLSGAKGFYFILVTTPNILYNKFIKNFDCNKSHADNLINIFEKSNVKGYEASLKEIKRIINLNFKKD